MRARSRYGMAALLWASLGCLVLGKPAEPAPWDLYFSTQSAYEGGRTTSGAHSGKASGRIHSVGKVGARTHALLVQKISAEEYRGRRIELSGFLKTEEVGGWAGIWLRVDGEDGQVLAFQNMMDRPVKGTTDWKRYEIQVDVPVEAFEIHFGGLLAGSGTIFVDDFELKSVGGTRPAEKLLRRIRSLPTAPRDMDFES